MGLMRFRYFLLNLVVPLTRLIGKLHAPFTHKMITGKDYYSLEIKLKPGMVMLTRMRGELSNLFIPGQWTHAAIYVGDQMVVEATSHGVAEKDLVSFLTSKDYVLVRQPTFLDDAQMAQAAVLARSRDGMPYDWDFRPIVEQDIPEADQPTDQAFYCSKLLWWAYDQAYQQANHAPAPFTLRETWGVPTVTPADFAQATSKFMTIYDSRQGG